MVQSMLSRVVTKSSYLKLVGSVFKYESSAPADDGSDSLSRQLASKVFPQHDFLQRLAISPQQGFGRTVGLSLSKSQLKLFNLSMDGFSVPAGVRGRKLEKLLSSPKFHLGFRIIVQRSQKDLIAHPVVVLYMVYLRQSYLPWRISL